MNQSQINRVEMLETTNTFLDTNTAVWSAIPIANNYKIELNQLIAGIKSAAQDQEAAQVTVGGSIQNMKRQLSDKLDILDDSLEAYAADKEMAELAAQADNSMRDYLRLPHTDFQSKVKNMLDLLDGHVADMADYGLTQVQIDEVKDSFGAFEEQIGKPRSYQIASRIATQSLDDLFKEAIKITEKLDRIMKRFKRSNSSFYNGYLASRMIVDN
ncbi:MAG: hypothetical protein AAFY41_05480 [Bacteroidota bacterium]